MLNIHTKLLDLLGEGKLTPDEFIILLLISKRVGSNKKAFPSIKLLQKESTFGRDKVQKCISNLVNKGFLEKKQMTQIELKKMGYLKKVEKAGSKFAQNLYTIKTNLIGVYINVKDEELVDEPYT